MDALIKIHLPGAPMALENNVIFVFIDHNDYIVFTDNSEDEVGNIVTYAAVYDKNGETLELQDIETDEEWNLIENLLANIDEANE